jgi:D-alanyl-lipoteichoic acid acyltransferase DltB (MBOAT superfamily)
MISYVFDVYNGKMKAQKNFITYALYLAFFVQLVAGPIERAQNLIPQFYEEHKFSFKRLERGLQKILWGYFKKMVVADRLSIFVDAVYADPVSAGGTAGVVATVFFAFQIYCDFSGYCDIAIGIAEIMGFSLTKNFDCPYLSSTKSIFNPLIKNAASFSLVQHCL